MTAEDRPEIRLSDAGVAHAAVLASLHAGCFDDPWSEAEMAGLLAIPGTRAIIATTETDDTPMAFAVIRTVADESEIITLGVAPPWRRRGVGCTLLGYCQNLAMRDGARRMILEVAENNRAALALYEVAGYNAVGHRPDYYRNRDGRRQSARILARDLCDL